MVERKKERGVKVVFATFGKGSRLLAVPCFSQRLGFLGGSQCMARGAGNVLPSGRGAVSEQQPSGLEVREVGYLREQH